MPALFRALRWIARAIDGLNEAVGRVVGWFALAMVLITVAVVVLRYGFTYGSIALQESVMYLHGYLFMLGAAYTLKHDGHVRVDIFYNRLSARARGWVDLAGSLLLLLPMFLYIGYSSWDYVWIAWRRGEGSPDAGGLPYVYVLKFAILLLALLMLLQGISQAIKALMAALGHGPHCLEHTREGQQNV